MFSHDELKGMIMGEWLMAMIVELGENDVWDMTVPKENAFSMLEMEGPL